LFRQIALASAVFLASLMVIGLGVWRRLAADPKRFFFVLIPC
jgi:hypothetical protein